MKKLKAFVFAAVLCLGIFSGCGNKNSSSSSESSGKSNSSSSSAENLVLPPEGEVGELITPDEDSEEYELGSYRMSHNGVKLYYSDDIPTDLMLALEKYFNSLQTNDYEAYKACILPEYITSIEDFLQKNYQYGLDSSFEKQCSSLSVPMGGSFEVTRIKAAYPEEHSDDTTDEPAEENTFDKEKSVTDFLAHLDSLLGGDFSKTVRENTDDFEYVTFYVMANNSEGVETTLVSEYDILFALKDGKYYTFG